FREMQAKGPKGRHYYQMWLGLNDEKGTAIYFQLIYPEYLTEPTQSQKNLWKNFVKKTQFLSYEDLLVLRESPAGEKTDYAYFKIEKRRSVHKFFIQATPTNENANIQIQEIKDHQPISGHFGRPFLEISLLIITDDHSIVEGIV